MHASLSSSLIKRYGTLSPIRSPEMVEFVCLRPSLIFLITIFVFQALPVSLWALPRQI